MSEIQKKVWITGASSGIGKALAIKFSNEMFNPIEVGFYRTAIGALFLFFAVRLRKGTLSIYNENTKIYSLIGLLNAAIPFTLLPYGLISLPSNIVVIIFVIQSFPCFGACSFFYN